MKQKKNIVILIAIFVLISLIILPKSLGDLDELWNYSFAKNIAEGRLPYRDFNMIQTPLLPLILGLILKLFANELIVMRILAIVLCTTVFFLVYKILEKRLNINTYVGLGITVFLIYIFKDHVRIDYNFAVLLMVLILIYLELGKKISVESSKKYDLLIGVIAGTSILFKQTTGLAISAITIGYKILEIEKKENIKKYLKIVLYRMIGVFIPLALFALYLITYGIWSEFIDYTILGVKTFSNSIPYTNLFENDKIIIKILAVVLPIFLAVQGILGAVTKQREQANKYIVLFSYSVASAIVIFPITDEIHFLIGTLPCIIGMFYIIYNIINKFLKGNIKVFLKYFIQVASILIFICFIVYQGLSLKNKDTFSSLNHYSYIPISNGIETQIKEMIKYLNSNEDVYILDSSSIVYKIPLDTYSKNYDMFLKGNLGSKGEGGIIEDLKNKEDIKVLIMKEKYSRNWQNPEEVRKYITGNWNKTGEIQLFDIYEK